MTDYITSFCPQCGKSQWREHPAKCDGCGCDVIPEPGGNRRPWPPGDPTESPGEYPEPRTPAWVIGVLAVALTVFLIAASLLLAAI